MNFFDRYTQLCAERQMLPSSQKAAEMFGVTRSTIASSWGKHGGLPKGETLIIMADKLEVSVDYLLGLTDVPKPTKPVKQTRIQSLYDQLDPTDQVRLESYAEGMLTSDKYRAQTKEKVG